MEDIKKEGYSREKIERKTQIIREVKEEAESAAGKILKELKKECETYGELKDKIRELERSFKWEGMGDVGNRIDKMINEEINKIPITKTWYLCDGKIPTCTKTWCYIYGGGCRHTSDIAHAANFVGKSRGGDISYWETDGTEAGNNPPETFDGGKDS